MYDFLTGDANDASDNNSTVEAHESWDVSSMARSALVAEEEVASGPTSSNGRFFDVSRERRTMEDVEYEPVPSNDESGEEGKIDIFSNSHSHQPGG